MEDKKMNALWGISLFTIGIVTLVLAGSNVIGAELPDLTVRILGGIDLIALPVLVYSTVKKVKNRV